MAYAAAVPSTTAAPTEQRSLGRRALLVGAPAIWVGVALAHPMGELGTIYEDLHDQVDVWMSVHLLQLVLAVGLGSALWLAVRGHPGTSATLTRLAVPVYLVFFAAFDAVAGIATGLALHHATTLEGAERAGAVSTLEYLADNRFASDFSPVWALGETALLVAIVGAALTFRRAGATRATWVLAMVGVLSVMHSGPPAAIGFAALAVAMWRADRQGLVADLRGPPPW